jgi:hypothetical protein
VTEFPVEPERLPQVELTVPLATEEALAETTRIPGLDERTSETAEPLMLQLRVAEPLASLAMDAESVTGDPLAAVVGVALAPEGKVMATALTVKAVVAVLVLSAAEVAVIEAVQLAFSDDSAGGV